FAECLLHDVVIGTPLTAKNDQQLAGTFLYRAIYRYRPDARPRWPADDLDEYRAWAGRRDKLTRAQATSGFTLGFQLEEAPAADVDDWQLHFQVSAKRDPSHRLRLADYWDLGQRARVDLTRPFGPDFEKRLLLDLGHAARIYPEVWRGLETSRPAGFRLTLEEAFSFLRESALILEDAGYTVSVPAWWTPEGRRRAKLRLKTAQRQTKGKTGAGAGYLGFDPIVAYQYELSIGDAAVSEEEWRQLVEARTPLVRFRGQTTPSRT
ncbi:MAG: SNF2 helicase-associated domain-containing protein, partial [Actinobacteria bacterium]|nr:SNF2 helicase-associated domain-containing protein [Actinomycetota bacterium]